MVALLKRYTPRVRCNKDEQWTVSLLRKYGKLWKLHKKYLTIYTIELIFNNRVYILGSIEVFHV